MADAFRSCVEQPFSASNSAVSTDRPWAGSDGTARMIGLRHTDEWVGLLVIIAVALFIGSVLEAGVLHDWFRPVSHLRIVLPQSGVGGLAVGAEIEVLGTHAGTVRRIVLNPDQQMYAEADIDQQAIAFIRRDSQAFIRRRFGV